MTDKWFHITQLSIWIGFGILTRHTWLDTRPPSWTWIALYMGLGYGASMILAWIFRRLVERSFAVQVAAASLGSLVLGLLWRLCFNTLEYHVLESANNAFRFWGYFHNGKSAVIQLVAWSTGFWMVHHYHRALRHQQRAQAAELQAKSATLKLLQSQVDPHFLFNALGSLDTLLLKNDAVEARRILGHLTQFLRGSLASAPAPTTPFDQEIDRVRAYLAIESMRYGPRLHLVWHLPETLPKVPLPSGILLPLAENAITHGISQCVEGGTVEIAVTTKTTHIHTTITNPVAPNPTNKGLGTGLNHTRQRLATFYEGAANLSVTERPDRFRVTLEIPNHELEGAHRR
ncbi:Histidine kinase [Sulfidibacter corallicola]|uniref:Histidine kinase n=1 Tax=Sulfidibacter corallicola TaxID=2818388 RepID=A0A8A4TI78_SULCO|nr:histidine kinase [Sulfidibacter corallicola]QTD48862.1 histidine kinase [Sulfidibacter corallicola]